MGSTVRQRVWERLVSSPRSSSSGFLTDALTAASASKTVRDRLITEWLSRTAVATKSKTSSGAARRATAKSSPKPQMSLNDIVD